MSDEKIDIEVIKGDGKDLSISNVYDHIKKNTDKIEDKNKDEVVVPKSSKNEEKKEN